MFAAVKLLYDCKHSLYNIFLNLQPYNHFVSGKPSLVYQKKYVYLCEIICYHIKTKPYRHKY